MTQEELRGLQRPIKDRYREDPAAAQVTLRADGSLEQGIACSVQTGQALVEAGLHPDTGGDGTLACSGDMLLQALVACAGVTMRSVATSIGLAVAGAIHAEGDLDWRGTLALPDARGFAGAVGFTRSRVGRPRRSEKRIGLPGLAALVTGLLFLGFVLGGAPRLVAPRQRVWEMARLPCPGTFTAVGGVLAASG